MRRKGDVLTRALRTINFNEVKHTIMANILNISETHTILQKCSTVKYIVQEKMQFTKSATRSNTPHTKKNTTRYNITKMKYVKICCKGKSIKCFSKI